jgi:hypothetical protein
MNARWFGLALTLAGSLTLARSARADIPPPQGYVETCTIANQQTATSECLFCEAERSAADRCDPLLSPYCYVKVCQAWGGSGYPELWCRTKGAEVAPVPSETLNALNPTVWPLPPAPDGGAVTAPRSCLPYSPPTAPDAGGAGGQGGASAQGGSGGRGGTGGQSVIGGTTVTGGQSAVTSTPAAGGAIAVGGAGAAPAGGAAGTSGSDRGKPDNSSGCAVGGWLSAKALGPWLLAGLFGAIVMLARRRRR